jgi:hypothetical protein
MPQRTQQQRMVKPEVKFGPYPGGISIAVWLNDIKTDGGPRKMRSITISPRRYHDPDSGDWVDAQSFRPGDVPVLVFGLQKALDYVFTTPIPGQEERDAEAHF